QVPGGHSGASAVRLANGGTTAGSCVLNDTPGGNEYPTPSGKFTAWLWVRAETPGATLKLKLSEWATGEGPLVGSATAAISLMTSWQLISVSYAPLAPGASTLDYTAYVNNAAAGAVCFYADDAILRFAPG